MVLRLFSRISGPRALGLATLASLALAATSPAGAQPYLLFDPQTGAVLAEHQAANPWYPASLTKLMTAYVAFRALRQGEMRLDSPVGVSENSLSQPPAKMGIPVGQKFTLDTALKMMIVKSANDIAVSVAEAVGGTEAAFVQRMNYEAARLGMTQSHWANPNGLYDPANRTSARDLAILTRAIITEFPEYAGYFDIPALKFGKRMINATNRILVRYPGADGMKTGFICQSGFNLVASATRNGKRYVAIVLGETSGSARMETAGRLLERAFTGGNPPQTYTVDYIQPDASTPADPVDMKEATCGKNRFHSEDEADSKDVGDTSVSYLVEPFHLRDPIPIVLGLPKTSMAAIQPPPVAASSPLNLVSTAQADEMPKAEVKPAKKAAPGKKSVQAKPSKKRIKVVIKPKKKVEEGG